MSTRTLAGSCALVLALAAPAAAHAAPTIAPLEPCYVTAKTDDGPQREPVQITGAGFTPNASVNLLRDGAPVKNGSNLQADELGNLPVEIPAPIARGGTRDFTVTLTEVGNPANTASATSRSTALAVSVKPEEARPSDRIRFKGSGFTEPDRGIYAHYLYKGKLRKTKRMARKPGDCGSFEVRRRQIPVKRPGLGLWTIQFDQSKDFVDPDVTPIVFVRLGIRIRLVRE